jgi:very-short-patch-repair endonuclease
MSVSVQQNLPRNGEGDHAKRGGGVAALSATHANVKQARQLRREMSFPEVLLWQALRKRPGGFRFRRQHPQIGYVADFACLEARLAIEIDSEAHERGDRPERDGKRDATLLNAGFTTLRIPAKDVLRDLEAVLTLILTRCRALTPLHHPTGGPPPRSGEDFA